MKQSIVKQLIAEQSIVMYTCTRCNKVGDDTEINREGQLHHNSSLICKDHKGCTRRVRKIKRGKR